MTHKSIPTNKIISRMVLIFTFGFASILLTVCEPAEPYSGNAEKTAMKILAEDAATSKAKMTQKAISTPTFTPSPSPSPTKEKASAIEGIYYLKADDGVYTFFRFFLDGKVTTVSYKFDPPKSTEETYQAAKDGLNPDTEGAKVGAYTIQGSEIEVTFPGTSWGTRRGEYTELVIKLEAPNGQVYEYTRYGGEP